MAFQQSSGSSLGGDFGNQGTFGSNPLDSPFFKQYSASQAVDQTGQQNLQKLQTSGQLQLGQQSGDIQKQLQTGDYSGKLQLGQQSGDIQKALQGSQQAFQGGQSALDRAQQQWLETAKETSAQNIATGGYRSAEQIAAGQNTAQEQIGAGHDYATELPALLKNQRFQEFAPQLFGMLNKFGSGGAGGFGAGLFGGPGGGGAGGAPSGAGGFSGGFGGGSAVGFAGGGYGQGGNMAGGGNAAGSNIQYGKAPTSVYSPDQIQNQVNSLRANNSAQVAGRNADIANKTAGQGFGSNSPLAMALQNQNAMGGMMNDTAIGRDVPFNLAQANANQATAAANVQNTAAGTQAGLQGQLGSAQIGANAQLGAAGLNAAANQNSANLNYLSSIYGTNMGGFNALLGALGGIIG
jgi:hypothetical protein